MKTITTLAFATAALAMAIAAPVAANTTVNFNFDNSPDGTVSAPIVGTGSFTTPDTLSNGDIALSSLSAFNFSFKFGSFSYTEADIASTGVILRFTNNGIDNLLTFGGDRNGPFTGSIDFVNAFGGLSFQPYFGNLYFETGNNTYGDFGVAAAAVPEPSSWLMMLAGFGLVGAMARRRTAAIAA